MKILRFNSEPKRRKNMLKLDFSILDGVPNLAKPNDDKEQRNNASGKMYYKLEAEERQKAIIEEAAAKQLEVYAAHQEAIIKSGQLTSEITKGIRAGEKLENLFLKAIECISLMTGDKLFYELNKNNLKNTYRIETSEPVMEAVSVNELEDFLKN